MKSFVIAIILFSLVTIAVIINSVAVGRIFSDISSLISDLPLSSKAITAAGPERIGEYNALLKNICKQWNEKKKIVAISTPHDEADKFTAMIVEAAAYFKEGDYASYLAKLANAKQALHHLSDGERLNLDNIS